MDTPSSNNRNDKSVNHEILIPADKYKKMSWKELKSTIDVSVKIAGKDIFLHNPDEPQFLDEMNKMDNTWIN
jgi:hypothetical protein